MSNDISFNPIRWVYLWKALFWVIQNFPSIFLYFFMFFVCLAYGKPVYDNGWSINKFLWAITFSFLYKFEIFGLLLNFPHLFHSWQHLHVDLCSFFWIWPNYLQLLLSSSWNYCTDSENHVFALLGLLQKRVQFTQKQIMFCHEFENHVFIVFYYNFSEILGITSWLHCYKSLCFMVWILWWIQLYFVLPMSSFLANFPNLELFKTNILGVKNSGE